MTDKEAKRDYDRLYRDRNRERLAAQGREYYQANTGSLKERARAWYWANREKGRAHRRQYYEAHRAEAIERTRIWRLDHPGCRQVEYWRDPEKYRGKARQWRVDNPLKARALLGRYRRRLSAGRLGRIDYEAIVARDRNQCGICGKLVPTDAPSFDHIVPLARGGAHAQWNLQLTHWPCNRRRGAGRIPAQTRMAF